MKSSTRNWLYGRTAMARITVAVAFLAMCGVAPQARGADLEVACAAAMGEPVKLVAAEFEKATGHHVKLTLGAAGEVAGKVQGGQRGDVVILPPAFLAPLQEKGMVRKEQQVPLASSGIGIGMRADATAPGISTPEAFRAALLSATKIYHTDPKITPTGGHYAKITERLGIADQLKSKSNIRSPETAVADMVKDTSPGPVLVFIAMSVIRSTPGAKLVGPLPGDLQNTVTWVAALGAKPLDAAAAAAFHKALVGDDAKRAYTAAGFDAAP
jgi:molybdate transport system substrate-binding protein